MRSFPCYNAKSARNCSKLLTPIVATAITSFINLVKDSTLVIIDVKTLLGAGLHFLAIELLELLDGTLIKRSHKSSTSRPFCLRASKNGEEDTAATNSRVI